MAPSRLEPPTSDGYDNPVGSGIRKEAPPRPGKDLYGSYRPADPESLSLESNFGPMDAESIGYLQPTSMDTPLEVMRERYERDGYLFVSAVFLYFGVGGATDSKHLAGQAVHPQGKVARVPSRVFRAHGPQRPAPRRH